MLCYVMYVCMYVYVYVYVHVHVHVHVYVYVYVYVHACMYAWMDVCMYVCMHVCMYVYMWTYICAIHKHGWIHVYILYHMPNLGTKALPSLLFFPVGFWVENLTLSNSVCGPCQPDWTRTIIEQYTTEVTFKLNQNYIIQWFVQNNQNNYPIIIN